MSEEKEVVFDISEPEVIETEEAFDTEGLLDAEIEMAKEHGLIKEIKDGEHKEQSKVKTSEDSSEKEEEVNKDPNDFDQIDEVFEKDEKKFHETYTSNQKALYFKNKSEKRKRQEAVKERDEYKSKYELDSVKSMVATKKLEQVKEALANPDLTVEQLQSIIDSNIEFKQDKKLYTKEELELEKQQEELVAKKETNELNERILLTEEIGKSKDKDFDALINYAKEVFEQRPSKQKLFRVMLTNPNDYDENEIADFVIETAKLNAKYGQGTPESKEKVDRAISNSKKKISSAALSASGKSGSVPESELTVEQATRLSTDQWSKLSEKTKKRILMGKDPD